MKLINLVRFALEGETLAKYLTIRTFSLLMMVLISQHTFSANNGKILRIDFVASTSAIHPDVVQILLEGGYNEGSCNTVLAAIRKTEDHLVSAAMSAKILDKPIQVGLNPDDIYWAGDNRCTIINVSIE